jgi:DNA-binding MarR family transcriptional regulator
MMSTEDDVTDDVWDEIWRMVSFVQMSKNRKTVMRLLADSEAPMIPSKMAETSGIPINAMSRAVRQLDESGLVRCINEEAPRYRRYRLTDRGKRVWEKTKGLEE